VKKIFLAIFLQLSALISWSVPTIYEAETGVLTGVSFSTSVVGYSGTGYVTGFDNPSDNVLINVSVSTAGIYKLYVRYISVFGDKTQSIYVNGVFSSDAIFTTTSTFISIQVGTVSLNAGSNSISIKNNWGYVDIDNIGIEVKPPNVYNITPNLINPNANTKTKALYNLMRGQFGHCIFSGQTNYWPELIAISGKAPAVRGFDMQNYSPQNPWGWSGCCTPAYAAWDDGTVQSAIDWYNSTGGYGIVTFHWHWFSPSGGSLQNSTFYTSGTSFDVSRAVVTSNQEYTDVIRDIDAIAVQLKRLETAGVPVLWRPLHEAGGGWFWWGAKGPVACKALYDIMYDRLTNYHNINNLIWVWSTPEPAWYPGNSKVDIIGYDSYPGAYNYTTQKSVFDQLYTIVGGQKLIALSENGPIPNIAQSFSEDAPWSYFMSWVDLVTQQNTNAHIVTSYNQACNLSDISSLPVTFFSFTAENEETDVLLKWQTVSEIGNHHFELEQSKDGKIFNYINEIPGALNSKSLVSYQYPDKNPLNGISYYRLKQVDLNGAYTYSNAVSISREASSTLSIFPNPGFGKYKLRSNDLQDGNFDIKLYNSSGTLIFSCSKTFRKSFVEQEIDISQFPSGIYLLEIYSDNERIIHRLIKE
jgi:mannan endo-1,4-beta-mannosidase